MARADVMKDTGDGAAYAVVETLGRIGVDRAARILAIPMADGIVRGEGLTDRQERLRNETNTSRPKLDAMGRKPTFLGLVKRVLGNRRHPTQYSVRLHSRRARCKEIRKGAELVGHEYDDHRYLVPDFLASSFFRRAASQGGSGPKRAARKSIMLRTLAERFLPGG